MSKRVFNEIIKLPARPKLLAPATMAYIGDSVFELFIRTTLLEEAKCKPNKLHQSAVKYVNATAQAELLELIREELTEEESAIVRRGRNAKINVPSNANPADYHYSTAFEALIGYLYLANRQERLAELLAVVKEQLIVNS